jgi:hypothetical protein
MSEPNEKVITINRHHDYCSQRECASNFPKQIHYVKSVQELSAVVAETQLRTRETTQMSYRPCVLWRTEGELICTH